MCKLVLLAFCILTLPVSSSLPPLSVPEVHDVWSPAISPRGGPPSEMYTFSPERFAYKNFIDHFLASNTTPPHTELLIDFLEASHAVADDLRKLSEVNTDINWENYSGDKVIQLTRLSWLDDERNRVFASILLKGVIIIVTAITPTAESVEMFASRVGFTDACNRHSSFIHQMIKEAVAVNERRRNSRRMGVRSIHVESNIFASKLHAFCPRQYSDFETRLLILRLRIANEQYDHLTYGRNGRGWTSRGKFGISTFRDKAFDTAVELFADQQVVLIHGVYVQFSDELGEDHGGVMRDWFTELVDQINTRRLFVNDTGFDMIGSNRNTTELFVVGNLLGLAVIEGIGTGLRFPLSYMGFILEQKISLEDIALEDPLLYQTLRWAKEATAEELEETALDILETSSGEATPVTVENRDDLISRKLNSYEREDFQALVSIKAGFYSVVPPTVMSDNILTPVEVRRMIEGESNIDVFEMWLHIDLVGYDSSSPQIVWLWEILNDESSFTQPRLKEFLRFVTGLRYLPLGGFDRLERRITIAKLSRDDADMALPSAHTCVYQLNLPEYSDKEILRMKLIYAIEASPQMGFV